MRQASLLVTIYLVLTSLILVVCSGCMPATQTPAPSGALPDLGGRQVVVAVDPSYKPFSYLNPDTGEPEGWDFDTIREICKRLNCQVVAFNAQEIARFDLVQAVADGQFDMAGDGITITEDRKMILDFSEGYMDVNQVLMVASDESRKELGDEDVKSAVCGPAGEKLVRYANVMTGVKNSAGRTGMGAVMGSKNLKLVACRGTMDVKIAHPMEALEFDKRFIDQITSAKVNQTQGTLGTPFIWGATNSWGGVRTNNFQYNQLLYADDIEPERIDEIAAETMGPHHMAACFGCQVHCRAKYKIPEGPYAGKYDEGPEYTSQGAFGGEPGCTSALTILVCNHLVDKYGVDNLEIGSIISWAMELYENGILTSKDTDGLYWKAPDNDTSRVLEISLPRPVRFDRVLMQEPIQVGQRIASFAIHAQLRGKWRPITKETTTTIGYKRILKTLRPVTTSKIRFEVLKAVAMPCLSNFGLYLASPREK